MATTIELGPISLGVLGALTPTLIVLRLGPDDFIEVWLIYGIFLGLPSLLFGAILGSYAPRVAEKFGVPNLATLFSYLAGLATTGFIVLLGYGFVQLKALGIL